MKKRLLLLLFVLLAGAGGLYYAYWRRGPQRLAFTGFVEGEEKVIKSEITGRTAVK